MSRPAPFPHPDTMRPMFRRSHTTQTLAALAVVALTALTASAQTPPPTARTTATAASPGRPLSLLDALRIAEEQSEAVGIARASVTRARGEQYRARSQF